MMDLVRGRCEIVNVAAGMGVCRVNYTHEPDWAEVLRQAESVGLWTTVPETYVAMPDGTGATVELRTGSKYRAYEYKYNWRPKSWNHGENPSYDLSLALEMVDQLILPYTSSK
jgi:hypothetical protein